MDPGIGASAAGALDGLAAHHGQAPFQGLGHGQHAEGHVVLFLLAYKDIADLGIVEHVGYLRRTAGGVEGDGYRADAVAAEIHKEVFGLVLGKHAHILLDPYADMEKCVRHTLDLLGKGVPRDGHPLVGIIVAIAQCGLFAVLLGLLQNELGKVAFGLHRTAVFCRQRCLHTRKVISLNRKKAFIAIEILQKRIFAGNLF